MRRLVPTSSRSWLPDGPPMCMQVPLALSMSRLVELLADEVMMATKPAREALTPRMAP